MHNQRYGITLLATITWSFFLFTPVKTAQIYLQEPSDETISKLCLAAYGQGKFLPTFTPFWENKVNCYVVWIQQPLKTPTNQESLDFIEKNYETNIRNILKENHFTGKTGQFFRHTVEHNKTVKQFIFVGQGKLSDEPDREREQLRRTLCTVVHAIKKLNLKTAVISLPNPEPFGVSSDELAKQITIAFRMADYQFNVFKSKKTTLPWHGTLYLACNEADRMKINIATKQGFIVGKAAAQARAWADMPANLRTPTAMDQQAKDLAQKYGLTYTSIGDEKAKELGMGGFYSVSQGSNQPGVIVVLEYKTRQEQAPTIALVGKGICFDSGGLHLKKRKFIKNMNYDLCGATAVLSVMGAIAQLKAKVNVIGIALFAENMPSGSAAKYGDIVTFMNGKTVEIKNTDAEGRLILADGLCYANKMYTPDVIIDIATLTGAHKKALGPFYTGLMTRDNQLSRRLEELGLLTGDKVWRLPLDDDFKKALTSTKADFTDIDEKEEYKAGTIVAAHFLEEFVAKTKWAHLDIAGTSYNVPGINYLGKGATGAGVRLLTEFVMGFEPK